jgi:hypothetical protein
MATFSIPPGKSATVELKLNAAGRALLKAGHGRLSARLRILKLSPAPSQTHSDGVHLVQRRAHEPRVKCRSRRRACRYAR